MDCITVFKFFLKTHAAALDLLSFGTFHSLPGLGGFFSNYSLLITFSDSDSSEGTPNMDPPTVFTVNKDDILLGLLACFLPPIAVAVRQGFWRKDTLICFLLTAIFGFPGMFHAFYVIYTTSAERTLYDSLSGGPDLEAQNSVADGASSHKSAPSDELPPNYDEISDNAPPSGLMDKKTSQ